MERYVSKDQGVPGQTLPELLAPAGSWDALRAAIGAGADAVYLGGKRFGARAYAENFDDDALVQAMKYAHRADVGVYVTVNTLLSERDLVDAAHFLLFLYEQGADGVLVQDAGLVSLARHVVPRLPLHASTQMTVHHSTGVRWAAGLGLRRVVLARELSIPEIREIGTTAQETGIGLEIFVHGALCYSYSGQCMLSSSIGGRSGNRGRCAQPCRKPYHLIHGARDVYDRIPSPHPVSAPSYFLSTRDLCTYLHLKDLVDLPVQCLKIEGRMKSPQYVATVVRIYRRALDEIGAGTWEPRKKDLEELLLAFNRGFTGGHLFGERVMGTSRPDHQGLRIGKVTRYDPLTRAMEIRLTGDAVPEAGDGIHVLAPTGEEIGMRTGRSIRINGPILHLPVPEPVMPGSEVFITSRASLERAAEEDVKRTTGHRIAVDVDVTWEERKMIFFGRIHRRDGMTVTVRYESPLRWDVARNQPLTGDQIEAQICRTGGTPFIFHIRHIDYPGGLFIPLGELNDLRRTFVEWIESALLGSYRPAAGTGQEARERLASFDHSIHPGARPGNLSLITWVTTVEGARGAMETGCDRVCLEADLEEVSDLASSARESGIGLTWMWPRITREKKLRELLQNVPGLRNRGVKEIMVAGAGAGVAIKSCDPRIELRGAVDLNIWNACSIRAFAPLFHSLVLSPEMSLAQIQDISRRLPSGSPSCEVIVQGNLEVIVSENCPDERIKKQDNESWGFLDQRDRFFPLVLDTDGRTHIYNAVETCYIDHLPTLREAGIGSVIVDARHRSPQYAKQMTGLYREALRLMEHGKGEGLTVLKSEVQRISRGGITRGPLLRGLREEEE